MKNNLKNTAALLCFIVLLLPGCGKQAEITQYGVFAPSRLEHVKGQDGVTPIDFNDAYTMWTFGDTIIENEMISNSLAFTPNIDADNIMQLPFTYYSENGRIVPFIRNKGSEDPARDRLWAFDGMRVGNTVYVYYAHVYINEPSKPLAFSVKGSSVARWQVPDTWRLGDRVRFTRVKSLFSGDMPAFGASVLRFNEYVYVTGHKSKNNKSSLVIARVHPHAIMQKNSYEFLQSDGSWAHNIMTAVYFYDDVAGECSLGFSEKHQLFYIVYCQLFTGNIVMCMAPTVEQLPRARKMVLYSPEALKGSNMMYYSAKSLIKRENSWFIIYMHPLEYQPYLIRADVRM